MTYKQRYEHLHGHSLFAAFSYFEYFLSTSRYPLSYLTFFDSFAYFGSAVTDSLYIFSSGKGKTAIV